jgi:hypothetical protein
MSTPKYKTATKVYITTEKLHISKDNCSVSVRVFQDFDNALKHYNQVVLDKKEDEAEIQSFQAGEQLYFAYGTDRNGRTYDLKVTSRYME